MNDLEIILKHWRIIKAETLVTSLSVHDYPVWKLDKDWIVKPLGVEFPKTYTAKPKDKRIDGITLFGCPYRGR